MGPANPATLAVVPVVLVATAMLAAIVPAARALALEPTRVIRSD